MKNKCFCVKDSHLFIDFIDLRKHTLQFNFPLVFELTSAIWGYLYEDILGFY